MLLVLGLAALIWGAGAAFGQPRERRIVVLGMLFGLVIGLNLLLPQAHPLRVATGGSDRSSILSTSLLALCLAAKCTAGGRAPTPVQSALANAAPHTKSDVY